MLQKITGHLLEVQTHKRVSESVKEQVGDFAGVQKPHTQIAQERKMKLFGHVTV